MTTQFLRIEEAEGADPYTLTLSGGLLPAREGVAFETEQGGSKHQPIGSLRATQAVTHVGHSETELKLYAEVPYVGPGDILTIGTKAPTTPEALARLFVILQERGRQLRVILGAFVRLGTLRKVKAEPTRGYGIDFAGRPVAPGMNCEITLTFEWIAAGIAAPAKGTLAGPDLAGGLAAVSAKLPTLVSPDAWAMELLDKVRDGVSAVLTSIEQLKNLCRRVNNLVTAPARLANDLLSAAKSAAKSLSELDDLLARRPDEDLSETSGYPAQVRAKRAAGDLRTCVGDGMNAVVAVFDALAERKTREIGVRPGESLALVAKRELGSADRWPSIASLNEIAGQIVPAATFLIEVPGA